MPAVYSANIRDIASYAPDLMKRITRVFPDRARKIQGYVMEDDRLRSLAAGLLLDAALGGREILYGEHGKPCVAGGAHFSVSHSGDYAILATDTEPVGIDIEQWSDGDYAAMSRVSFHEDERAMVERDACAQTFFDIWTLRESYIKMLGIGFSADTSSFHVTIEGRCASIFPNCGAHLRLYDCLDGYSVAVCSTHSRWPEEITVETEVHRLNRSVLWHLWT